MGMHFPCHLNLQSQDSVPRGLQTWLSFVDPTNFFIFLSFFLSSSSLPSPIDPGCRPPPLPTPTAPRVISPIVACLALLPASPFPVAHPAPSDMVHRASNSTMRGAPLASPPIVSRAIGAAHRHKEEWRHEIQLQPPWPASFPIFAPTPRGHSGGGA